GDLGVEMPVHVGPFVFPAEPPHSASEKPNVLRGRSRQPVSKLHCHGDDCPSWLGFFTIILAWSFCNCSNSASESWDASKSSTDGRASSILALTLLSGLP